MSLIPLFPCQENCKAVEEWGSKLKDTLLIDKTFVSLCQQTTQQIIDDHKLFIDDLNSTGMDLMDLCGVSEATDLHNKLMGANTRYEALRSQARSKGRELAEKKREFTQEVGLEMDYSVFSCYRSFFSLRAM